MFARRRTRRITYLVAAVGVLVATASLPARPASADTTPMPEPGVCSGCTPPLTYHGGPVMGTSTVTITPIYWAPNGYTYPGSYVSLVNQYIADVAAASGKSDNAYAIAAEYYQQSGGQQQSIGYSIQAGAPVNDTNPYPQTTDPCTITSPYTACVTRDQLRTELVTDLQANGLTADINHLYALFFPPNVQTVEGNAKSGDVYCGIHGAFDLTSGGTVIYADEPYLTTGCGAGQMPNGDLGADTQVGTLSHEIIEAITDPQTPAGPAWFDASGNEIGDECSYNYGPPLGSTDPNNPQTTQYNQVINGHYYYTQLIFSNASYAGQGIGKGCIGGAYGAATPAALTIATGDAPATATLDASEVDLPADGRSTSDVTMSVFDGGGEPISGDHIHIDVRPLTETPGHCGAVTPSDGVTDDNGEFKTTFTASTDNVACFVMGVDAESGSSDSATIYQGSSSDIQPGITDASVPGSLTPGGGAQTFTVTASNPSSTGIADARFDVFLTGDNNGSGGVGLRAAQVHLAYSDETTNGSFVSVPLTGETVRDGEIDAYVMPDKAASLPAKSDKTVTFQISLDGGAPTSAQTGTPLHIETDLDQYDPADDSQFNLDYVGPADVTVGGGGSSGGGLPLVAIIVIIVVGGGGLIALGVLAAIRRRRAPPPATA